MIWQKLQYLVRSTLNFNQVKQCPNCDGKSLQLIDTKYVVTKLYKCENCKLNFRFPVDSKEFSENFYQEEYKADYSTESKGITDLPSDEELAKMMANNFYGKRDYAPFVKALHKPPSAKVVDYGCSWGYSVFQLKKAGFDAEGFDVSMNRAKFGEKIGVKIHSDQQAVRQNNDVIMSSHAIEHLPVISDFVDFAASKLVKDGIFISFSPNGSPEFRAREPHNFHVNWGLLHPNYLDVEFAAHTFRKNPYLILTDDWRYNFTLLENWDGRSQIIGNKRDGQELLIIAKPNILLA